VFVVGRAGEYGYASGGANLGFARRHFEAPGRQTVAAFDPPERAAVYRAIGRLIRQEPAISVAMRGIRNRVNA
jgi:hypothetical protein